MLESVFIFHGMVGFFFFFFLIQSSVDCAISFGRNIVPITKACYDKNVGNSIQKKKKHILYSGVHPRVSALMHSSF